MASFRLITEVFRAEKGRERSSFHAHFQFGGKLEEREERGERERRERGSARDKNHPLSWFFWEVSLITFFGHSPKVPSIIAPRQRLLLFPGAGEPSIK